MLSDNRKSGIALIGELPWGSHFCQFYRTTEDLLDILLPYLEAGATDNELCVWVTSSDGPDAEAALEKAHGLHAAAAKGQVEIIPYSRWRGEDGKQGSPVVSLLDRAMTGGYDGLRIAFSAFSEQTGARAFAREIADIRRHNTLALFAYPRDAFDASRLMEIIKDHRFALVRNAGGWEIIESSEARKIRDELTRSERRLKSLFSNMSEGFAYHRIVLDGEGNPCDYIFLEVNEAFEKLTGLQGKDIIGKKATAVLPGLDKDPTDWIGKYGRVALTEKPLQFESYAAPLGRWYSVSAYCPQKGYFGVTFSDITDRKHNEEALQRAAAELDQRVRERTKELNALNETLDHRVTERTAELMAANETLRASRRASLNLMEDAVAARKEAEETSNALRREIEERSLVEEALKRSLRRFELLADTAGELLQSWEPQKAVESLCRKVMDYLDCQAFFNFLVDEKEGRLRLNAWAGIPPGEAERIEWLDFGTAVCGCAARDRCRIVAEHNPSTPDERSELVKSYGIKAYACHPLLGPGGKVIGTLSFGACGRETFSEDELSLMKAVTDQVSMAMIRMKDEQNVLKLNEDMAARNLELEDMNKELEAFIYSISHDLRAPLRSLSGFSRIMTEDYANKVDDKGRDYLGRIRNGAEKMTHLIDDLLRLSKISRQEVDRADYDLSALAEAVVHSLRETSPERAVEVVIGKNIRASVDPDLMRIAITNLLDNAWKFTGKTQKARIEFGNFERETRSLKPEARNTKLETVFYVKDNGAGFDPTYADKLFWPFHRLHTEKEFPGTGIGLAIVDRIIRRHGGTVWAEGEAGKGAVFFFTLG